MEVQLIIGVYAVFYLNSLAGDLNDGNDHWLWLNLDRDLFPHFVESAQIRHCYLCKGVLEEILISTSYHHHVPGTPNLLDRTKINRIFHCRRSENGKHGRSDDPEAAAAIVLTRPRLWGTRHGEPEKKEKENRFRDRVSGQKKHQRLMKLLPRGGPRQIIIWSHKSTQSM